LFFNKKKFLMSNEFYLFIVLAVFISFGITYFLYFYKNIKNNSTKIILFTFRFLAFFLILLLLINPKIKKEKVEIIKPSLVVMIDNTKSIVELNKVNQVKNIVEKIKNNDLISNKFNLDFYSFSDEISISDSIKFNKKATNISRSLQSVSKIYKNTISPILMLSDGNQTVGNNYTNLKLDNNVYPIIIGDTLAYQDIYISQLNVNKYAYLKNKFPVELFVNYNGGKKITSKLTITDGNTIVFSKNIQLNANKNSKAVSFFIPANTVGIHNYKAKLTTLESEKNVINNKKSFSVEIINEQSEILIVSNILHPDIAMLKRAIESNKQRKVSILKPNQVKKTNKYQLVIAYQPDNTFNELFQELNKKNKNIFIITGAKTDWNFLNKNQSYFSKKSIQKTENYLAKFNTAYTVFLLNDLGFDNYSPLVDYFGKVTFDVPYQSILFQEINNVSSNTPLLATFEDNSRRVAVLFGEGVWRWRMTSKIEDNSFEPFDEFINKLIQYLASTKKENFLEVANKSIFYENETVKINAQLYDANYVFNEKAQLWLNLTNKKSKKQLKYPFALKNNIYEVNISDLEQGAYSFKVFDVDKKNNYFGGFTILDYNIEQQFVNANKKDLNKLAFNTDGFVSYPDKINQLIDSLIINEKYKAIQKTKVINTSLINWKWILGIITLLLSIEWFIRKYKGYV